MVGLAEVRGRARHAARRRRRRHDPDQPLDLPRRGGGQGRLGDPQGAAAARARPGADRLPDLRPAAVRHGHGRRRDRAAARGLRGADRGRRARLRRQRHRRGLARRLRHHRRQERGPDLRPRQAAAEGSRRTSSSTRCSRRSTSRSTAARSRSTQSKSAEGAEWLQRIEDENADELTPGADRRDGGRGRAKDDGADAEPLPTGRAGHRAATPRARPHRLDEDASPVAGRRFTRTLGRDRCGAVSRAGADGRRLPDAPRSCALVVASVAARCRGERSAGPFEPRRSRCRRRNHPACSRRSPGRPVRDARSTASITAWSISAGLRARAC